MSFRPNERVRAERASGLVSDISFTSMDRKKESGELEQNQVSRGSVRQSAHHADDDLNERPSSRQEGLPAILSPRGDDGEAEVREDDGDVEEVP